MNKLVFIGALLLSFSASACRPFISCETTSNGRHYSDESRDSSLARSSAINQCTSSSYTSNPECRANVVCGDDLYTSPMMRCETSSNGRNYSDESRDEALAQASAIRKCTGSSYTSNAECRANYYCYPVR